MGFIAPLAVAAGGSAAATGLGASLAAGASGLAAGLGTTAAAGSAIGGLTALQGIGTGLSILSAGSSLLGGMSEARFMERNAAAQAQQIQAQGAYDIQQTRKIQRAALARQAAAYGASGVDITGGPLAAIGQTAYEQELDILTKKYSTDARARDVTAEGRYQASRARSQGVSQAMKTGMSILGQF